MPSKKRKETTQTEPTCHWGCIGGVIADDDYVTANCPFHDGTIVNGHIVRVMKARPASPNKKHEAQ
jgi:hypothetical protein